MTLRSLAAAVRLSRTTVIERSSPPLCLMRELLVRAVAATSVWLTCGMLVAAPAPQRPPAKCAQEAVAAIHEDIAYLAGPATEGRGTGTVGGRRAIEHIARRMQMIGLRPLEGLRGNGHLQEFDVPDPTSKAAAEGTTLKVWQGTDARDLTLGTDLQVFPFSPEGVVEAPLVFVGHGLEIEELGHHDYRGLDVAGKVVLLLRRCPNESDRNSAYWRHLRELSFTAKIARAKAAGAAAVVVVSRASDAREPEAPENLDWAQKAEGSAEIPAVAISWGAACALFADTKLGLRERQRLLDAGRSGVLGPVADVSVRLQVRISARRASLSTANVIGLLPGADPKLAGEYVLVAAHHDHVGRGEYGSLAGPEARGQIHAGADDNASGIAGMLQMASRLLARPEAPARSVLFVAMGASELRSQGCQYFLDHCPVPRAKLVAAVHLDTIGRLSAKGLWIEGAASGDGLGELVSRALARCQTPVRTGEHSDWRGDQGTVLRAAIPALRLTTGFGDHLRRPSDLAPLVDCDGVAAIAAVAVEVVVDLAGRPARLAFVPLRRGWK